MTLIRKSNVDGVLCGPLHTPAGIQLYKKAMEEIKQQVQLSMMLIIGWKDFIWRSSFG